MIRHLQHSFNEVEGLRTPYIDSLTLERLNIKPKIFNPEEERTQQATEWNGFFQPMPSFQLAQFPVGLYGDSMIQEMLDNFENAWTRGDISRPDRISKGIYRMHAGHYAMRADYYFSDASRAGIERLRPLRSITK